MIELRREYGLINELSFYGLDGDKFWSSSAARFQGRVGAILWAVLGTTLLCWMWDPKPECRGARSNGVLVDSRSCTN